MEGLRGVAALLVLLVHYHSLFLPFSGGADWLRNASLFAASIGHTGVDLFFILSGYLIYGVMLKNSFRFPPYLARRARRLYPVFLGVFSAYILLSYLFPEKSKLPAGGGDLAVYLLQNLLMLPGILRVTPMITPAWSLSYEWLFYLLGPAVVWGTGMPRWAPRRRVLLLLGIAGAHLGLCALGVADHPRMAVFVAGCLLWEAVQTSPRMWLPATWEPAALTGYLTSLGIIGWMISSSKDPIVVSVASPASYSGLLLFSGFWFVAYSLFHQGLLARFFSLDILRWMGNISYSYYLVHGLVLHGLKMILGKAVTAAGIEPSPALYVALFPVALAVTVVAGAMLFIALERPVLYTKPAAAPVVMAGLKPGARLPAD